MRATDKGLQGNDKSFFLEKHLDIEELLGQTLEEEKINELLGSVKTRPLNPKSPQHLVVFDAQETQYIVGSG